MPQPRDQSFDHTMSFGDHLEELRRRVLWSIALPLPLACLLFFISDWMISWLLLPLFDVLGAQGLPRTVQQLGPAEGVVLRIKLSVIAALVISAPWVLWQLWLFVKPGLYIHERRFVHLLLPGSAVLTILAVALTYWGMLPLMLRVLVAMGVSLGASSSAPAIDPRAVEILKSNPAMAIFERHPESPLPGQAWLIWNGRDGLKRYVAAPALEGSPTAAANIRGGAIEIIEAPLVTSGSVTQDYRLSEYVSFTLLFLLGVVIAFQMPLAVLLLGWVGLASAPWLRQRRRYALFICAIVAAVVTPTADVISMLVLMVPLYLLYELGIVLLVLAPASAVAEGRVLPWKRGRASGSSEAHKQREPMDQPRQSAQTDLAVPRDGQRDRPPVLHRADGGEDGPS